MSTGRRGEALAGRHIRNGHLCPCRGTSASMGPGRSASSRNNVHRDSTSAQVNTRALTPNVARTDRGHATGAPLHRPRSPGIFGIKIPFFPLVRERRSHEMSDSAVESHLNPINSPGEFYLFIYLYPENAAVRTPRSGEYVTYGSE